eukprot:TRINITY_DN479_c1_g2_i4.p1 TRINITY_DN479_c1_g2~~TRINITY_DN479_c1_g2_i4.p1  ORF type:complete len:139 (+),score=14.89 TRINITY_DN479_c1_g2_i4:483-899(+)
MADPWASTNLNPVDTDDLFQHMKRYNGVDLPGRRTFVDYAVFVYEGRAPSPTREQWEAAVELMREALSNMVVVSSEGSGSSGAMNVVYSPDNGSTTGSEGSDPMAPGIGDSDGHDDESELRNSRSGDSNTSMDEERDE